MQQTHDLPYAEQFELMLGSAGHQKRLGISCVYCGRRSSTRDHVPSKVLLKRPFPDNYRTVPSCKDCNQGFSLDEEYVRTVIGLSSFDPAIMAENEPGGYIDRILSRAEKLNDRIESSLFVSEDGRVFITPEIGRVNRVCAKLACGLFALRYGAGRWLDSFEVQISRHTALSVPENLVAAMHYWPGIKRKRWTIIQPKVFEILFAKGWLIEDPALWCFINLRETIFAAVRCPAPPRGKTRVQLQRAW